MGRELKRVPLSIVNQCEINETWSGFLNPHYKHCHECVHCGGTGYNRGTRRIADDWYDFARTGRRWSSNITQDEVQALVDGGRLWDFTRRPLNDEHAANCHPNGWTIEPNGSVPSAAVVNDWSRHGFGHDGINRMICIEARAKRCGVWGMCSHCGGSGTRWRSPEDESAYDAWTETPPPSGDAYQIWQTVSEGGPVSPPFLRPADLAAWMVANDTSITRDMSESDWMKFIHGPGWAPSLVKAGRALTSGALAVVQE